MLSKTPALTGAIAVAAALYLLGSTPAYNCLTSAPLGQIEVIA